MEILDAAEQTLRRYGPGKASVTDVAKLLGVSHGTLYRHFPSKAALREAVTERWLEEKIVAPLAELAGSAADNPLEQLHQYIVRLIELKVHYATQDYEMFRMYAAVTEEAADLVEAHIERIISQISIILNRGIEQGVILQLTGTTALARSVFHATARFHHPSHAYEWHSSSISREFDELWSLLVRGLAATVK
ncbi:TetR family transcriptional regulator [Paenibacillus sp. PK3_47]|nr:TetR family transcriptional regulator [Paenibacillus sp. PK3_47]